jgi:hypothetical protein
MKKYKKKTITNRLIPNHEKYKKYQISIITMWGLSGVGDSLKCRNILRSWDLFMIFSKYYRRANHRKRGFIRHQLRLHSTKNTKIF